MELINIPPGAQGMLENPEHLNYTCLIGSVNKADYMVLIDVADIKKIQYHDDDEVYEIWADSEEGMQNLVLSDFRVIKNH